MIINQIATGGGSKNYKEVNFNPSAVLKTITVPELIGKDNFFLNADIKSGTTYTPSGALVITGVQCIDGVCKVFYGESPSGTYNVTYTKAAATFNKETGTITVSANIYFVHHFIYNGVAW